ncbi:helix-turn-helix domain-containing protein [Christiangramia forsetii]|uniref:helix-turn-helix domain-containing protein n=1 Tax=Christiangramia forsetii TaxID=411153 RepID=UPI0011D1D834|nr:AraC family transcriptional regulator [Christiangramia forsetii]
MKLIQVNSLPLEQVIENIASVLQVDYQENCNEFFITIPPDLGEGFIRGISFKSGLGLMQYDCTFKEDVEIQFIVNRVHPLKFLSTLKGSLGHRFENQQDYHEIQQYQCAIVASNNHHGHILYFKANVSTSFNSLEVARKDFLDRKECELKKLSNGLEDLFHDVEATHSFYHEGFYSLQIADIFQEIRDMNEKDFLKNLFLEGKIYQALYQHILQYQDDITDESNKYLLRRSEINLIKKAADIIDNEITNTGTIESIARRVGLNGNKLQTGFKKLYKATVNGYIQQKRLNIAKSLLRSTDLNISEIVDQIGLNSKSYFSRIFKEKYGLSPSKFRSKHLSKN